MTVRAMSAGTVETQSGSGRQPASAVAKGDGPQITGDFPMTDISKSEPVPATNQAGGVERIRAVAEANADMPEAFSSPGDRAAAIELAVTTAIAAALAIQPAKPQEANPYVAGPIWAESEDDCFTGEVQIVGGHAVVATVHGATRDEVEIRQSAITAALARAQVKAS